MCLAFSPAALGSLYLLLSTPCQLLRPPRRPPGSDPGVQRVSARSSMMTSVAAGVLASVRVHPTRLDESTARALVGRAALCFHHSANNHVLSAAAGSWLYPMHGVHPAHGGQCFRLKSSGMYSTLKVQSVHERVNKYSVFCTPSRVTSMACHRFNLGALRSRREPRTIDAAVRARRRASLFRAKVSLGPGRPAMPPPPLLLLLLLLLFEGARVKAHLVVRTTVRQIHT